MSCGVIVGFGFVSFDWDEIVACLLGLGLSLQGFDWLWSVWGVGLRFMRKVLIGINRTWVLLDRIGTVRKVLLELIGSDQTLMRKNLLELVKGNERNSVWNSNLLSSISMWPDQGTWVFCVEVTIAISSLTNSRC